MDIWKILNIGKTKDEKIIKKAYHEKLKVNNPEEDPEGFMELRKAFETAIDYAAEKDMNNEAEKENTPLSMWIEKVDQVYNTFSKRIDTKEWEKLLMDDVCSGLDTKIAARDALLGYMMDHFYLPQTVMQVLDRHFDLIENEKELLEIFPKGYIQYAVIDSIEMKEFPPYELFDINDDLDYENYLGLYSKLRSAIVEHETEKSSGILDEMDKLGIKHPYLEIDRAKVYCQEENVEEAEKSVEMVLKEQPDEPEVLLMAGEVNYLKGDYNKALGYFNDAEKNGGSGQWLLLGKAKVLTALEQYKEAKELIYDAMENDPYDMEAVELLNATNEKVIKILVDQMEKDKINTDDAIELIWSFFQNGRYKEAERLTEAVVPEKSNEISYFNVTGRVYLQLGDYDKALLYLKKWEQLLRELKDDSTAETAKQLSRLPYAIYLQYAAYMGKNDKENAKKKLMDTLKADEGNPEALVGLAEMAYENEEYEKAAEYCTKALERNRDNHSALMLRAKAQYEIGLLGEALDDFRDAVELYPFDVEAHIYMIKIYMDCEEYDEAKKIIEFMEGENIKGGQLDFFEGLIFEGQGGTSEAVKAYEKVISHLEEDDKKDNEDGLVIPVEEPAEVYAHLAVLKGEMAGEKYDEVIEIIDKGLEKDPQYVPLLFFKGHILNNCGYYDDALNVYKKILAITPDHPGIFGAIGRVYGNMNMWEKAKEYHTKQLEREETADAYMSRGVSNMALDELEEAWDDMEKAHKLDPNDPWAPNYMAVILEYEGQEREAVDYYETAARVMRDNDVVCDDVYRNMAILCCRNKAFNKAAEFAAKNYQLTGDAFDLYMRIEIFSMAGKLDKAEDALASWAKAEGISRSDQEYLFEKGNVAMQQGKFKKAVNIYEAAALPNGREKLQIGRVFYYMGKYKKALKYFNKAIKNNSEEEEFYIWAAKACLKMGDKSGAAEYAEKGLQNIPEDIEGEYRHCAARYCVESALIEYFKGGKEQSLGLLDKAINMRKCDVCKYQICLEAILGYVFIYTQEKEYDAALDWLDKGKEMAPVDVDIKHFLTEYK